MRFYGYRATRVVVNELGSAGPRTFRPRRGRCACPIGNAVGGAAAGPGANSEAAAAAQRHALQELGLEALKQKGAEAGVLASDVSHTGRKTPWVEDAIMKKCLGYNNNDIQ